MRLTIDHSPHQSDRRDGAVISCIVLHADVAPSAESSIAWLKSPRSRASYHAIIERDGWITQLVPYERKAWHAGASALDTIPDVNQVSIGICFSNKQDGTEPFTEAAIAAGVELCAGLCGRFTIPVRRIVTHAEIATPPGRKTDPGPLFDVDAFRSAVFQTIYQGSQ